MGCKESNQTKYWDNNNGTDQPAHLPSLISNIVIQDLESIIAILVKSWFSILKLVSVAEQTGLSPTMWQTTEIFLQPCPYHMLYMY